MHETRDIALDDLGVCLSVCLSVTWFRSVRCIIADGRIEVLCASVWDRDSLSTKGT